MKKTVIMLACIGMLGILGGCGQKLDASSYLKAYLDNAYKRNAETIVDAGALTQEEAMQIRNRVLDTELEKLARAVDMSVQDASGLRDNLEDAMFRATYTIGDAMEQPDGSFKVAVTYEQANVYSPIMTGYQGQLNTLKTSWSAMGEASKEQMVSDKIVVLESVMGPAVLSTGFDSPQTMEVRIEVDGDSFKVNEEDMNTLGYVLFDHEEASVR